MDLHNQEIPRVAEQEVVRLVGGPIDGQKFGWCGGDVITFVVSPPLGLVRRVWDPVPATPSEICYRRSLVSRDVFIFQQ